jgi:predicted phage terminase large subunit-like protein
MERMRASPGKVRSSIRNIAEQDGRRVRIRLPQDPGQAGKAQAQDFVTLLAGHTVRTKPVTGDKTLRAGPASSQAEAGNIDVMEGPWNEEFFSELENFPAGAHDDIVDALSDAIDELTQAPPRLSPMTSTSYYTG